MVSVGANLGCKLERIWKANRVRLEGIFFGVFFGVN